MGFEKTSYSVNESSGSGEICVLLKRPTLEELLEYTLSFVVRVHPGTAGELYCQIHVLNYMLV